MFDEDSIKGVLLVIADDEERQSLRQLFLGDNYDVYLADEAGDALSQLTARPIPLVICDIKLGRFSGILLLEEIKQQFPSVPVIMLCAESDISSAVACMRSGALDCLTRPYDEQYLLKLASSSVVMKIHDTVMFDRTAKQIAGYRVVCKIGDGSMGVVYLVQREGQRFAMKLLRVPPEEEDHVYELRQRFIREAKVAAQIHNPHVIRIVQYGMAGGEERPFIVMELLEGVTLDNVNTRFPQLTYRQQADLLRQLADALAAIHAQGLCHRDIKPANVMVNDYLHLTVMDFGLVHMPNSELTVTEDLLGSPAYLAPEAFATPAVDRRGDLFSFGVLAYEFLVGQLPFQADDIPAMMMKITMDRPVEPRTLHPGFPLALQNILAKLLKKKPGERYQDARDVRADFDAFLNDDDSQVSSTSTVGIDWKNQA